MFSHMTLGTNDLDRARRFYEPVMAALGIAQPFTLPRSLVFGDMAGTKLFIGTPYDGAAAAVGNGAHAAFLAPDRASVDAFHAAALANGGSDEGAPGPRPRYHAHYYGAYVRDPTATSCKPSATARPMRVDPARGFA